MRTRQHWHVPIARIAIGAPRPTGSSRLFTPIRGLASWQCRLLCRSHAVTKRTPSLHRGPPHTICPLGRPPPKSRRERHGCGFRPVQPQSPPPRPSPVLLELAVDRWRIRIFELEPVARPAADVTRPQPLRDDALQALLHA
jgi:hypothetical protein